MGRISPKTSPGTLILFLVLRATTHPSAAASALQTKVAFGVILRRRRIELHLTQEQLSWMTLIDRKFISAIERGQREPCLLTIFKLASSLNLSPSQLLAEVERVLQQSEQ